MLILIRQVMGCRNKPWIICIMFGFEAVVDLFTNGG